MRWPQEASRARRCSSGCTAQHLPGQSCSSTACSAPRQAGRRRHRPVPLAMLLQVVVVYLASAADLLPSPEEWPQVWAEQEAWKKAREAFDKVRGDARPWGCGCLLGGWQAWSQACDAGSGALVPVLVDAMQCLLSCQGVQGPVQLPRHSVAHTDAHTAPPPPRRHSRTRTPGTRRRQARRRQASPLRRARRAR